MFVVVFSIIAVVIISAIAKYRNKNVNSKLNRAPLVQPCYPLLGNSLQYKDSPNIYLQNAAKKYPGIFRINLAGLETTILTSESGMKQFAMASENILSSKAAVADFGFLFTLGEYNVMEGTDIHKDVLKEYYFTIGKSLGLKNMNNYIAKGLDYALCVHNEIPDFLAFVRKVTLYAVASEFIGTDLFHTYENFVDEFIVFQDFVEDCTAQAAVLPRWLALRTCLWECEKRRSKLTKKLISAINEMMNLRKEGSGMGAWLRYVTGVNDDRSDRKSKNLPVSLEQVAELCVGLMFAAHKNPAIAAAQTILLTLEHSNHSEGDLLADCTAEALLFMKTQTHSTWLDALDRCDCVHRCVMECLRVTAHSIGAVRKVQNNVWSVQLEDGSVYHVPKDCYVGVSHIIPNTDRERWGDDCCEFHPSRVPRSDNFANDYVFTTFSHGVHRCPGQRIAVVIVKLVVMHILHRIQIDPSKSKISKVSFERATLAQRSSPCVIQYTLR